MMVYSLSQKKLIEVPDEQAAGAAAPTAPQTGMDINQFASPSATPKVATPIVPKQPVQSGLDINSFTGAQPPATEPIQPTTVTGHTLDEHMRALSGAVQAGDKTSEAYIRKQLAVEQDYQDKYGATQKQQDATAAKADTLEKARNLLTVLDQGKNGELTGQQYTDALNAAASQYTAAKAFGEGGKNLTANELAVLSGQIPVIRKKTGNPLEKIQAFLGGYEVPQTGELAPDETPQRLRNKMIRVINTLDPNAKLPYPKGTEATAGNVAGEQTQQGEKFNLNIVENALNEISGGIKATPEIAKMLIAISPPGEFARYIKAGPNGTLPAKQDLEGVKAVIGGMVQDLSKTTGISVDNTGHVTFDPVGALVHDWNHPLSTLAYLTAIKQVAGIAKGAKGAEVAATAAKAGEAGAGTVAKEGAIGAVKGRVLTSVASPVADSVTKSEQLMRDVYQITKAPTVRGIAKELEAFVPKTGAQIEKYATNIDKVIGPQPLDELVTGVANKLGENSVGQTNPALIDTVKKLVENKLQAGQLPGGMERGQIGATTMSKMNETRKYLNSSISSKWFENGMPLTSTADQLNALKWEASNAIKDAMIEADKGGYFAKAINLQHSALSTGPVMAKQALTGLNPNSAMGIRGAMLKAGNKLLETPRVLISRAVAGKGSPITQQIFNGQIPPVPGPAAGAAAAPDVLQSMAPAPAAVPPMRQPLPPEVTQSVIAGKGPAQSSRLVRDMRFNQGNFQSRAMQDRLLRQAGKKRYK